MVVDLCHLKMPLSEKKKKKKKKKKHAHIRTSKWKLDQRLIFM